MSEFTQALTAFRNYAYASGGPEYGKSIDAIISSEYPQGLGDLAPTDTTSSVSTISKITDFVDTVAGGYLNTLGKYYETKGKLADLKLKAQGNLVTQGVNTATSAISSGYMPWILGGVGILAVVMLSRK